MGNLDNLYLHSMVHPDVAAAFIAEEDVHENILRNEVPDTSVQAHMNFVQGTAGTEELPGTTTGTEGTTGTTGTQGTQGTSE